MKLYNLKCPNCGATLATDVKNKYAKCEYCGNEFMISDDTGNDMKQPAGNNTKGSDKSNSKKPAEQKSETAPLPAGPENHGNSRTRDFLIVFLIVTVGLVLSLLFDREKPQDIVPKTDLHRFFMELKPDSRPQDIETLAKKHKLHYFRTEKMVNSDTPNTICYKVAKTGETALDKQGAHAETVEIEFDMAKNNTFKLAVYADPEHITGRALLFKYGTYNSLSAEDANGSSFAGYYYYNNSLRSAPGDQKTYPPYLKCTDAAEALRKIYTFRK